MSKFIIKSAPFATRLRATLGAREILERDRKRAAKFLAGLSPHGPGAQGTNFRQRVAAKATGSDSIDVTDSGVTYTMSVGVGTPPTKYDLLIDTGSSNTWVGANKAYKRTSTSHATGNSVGVSYGSGEMAGEEYYDTVTLNQELVIQNQSVGVAEFARGFQDTDGILGVGPASLTKGTVSNTSEVPTVTDSLYSQGLISSASLGIFYEPSSEVGVANGELTFGGTDSTRYTGQLDYVPITSTSPASNYWGIDQSVTYGGSTALLGTTSGIVDTGTTLLLLATDAFDTYQQATGAILDQWDTFTSTIWVILNGRVTGPLDYLRSQSYNQLKSMQFNIGKATYELTRNAQIWPRALNRLIGGQEGHIYLITADLGSKSGSGLDFINGFGWLQRFYSVFDTGKSRVGFAKTPFTDAETN